MESGRTKYAGTSDGVSIAYRTWGTKEPVHVFLSEFGATVDTRDMHPSLIRLWRQLAAISEVVSLDRRNIGSSDRTCPQRFDLDDYVVDILAVVDAIGAEQVILTGEGSSSAAAIAFTVAHPNRVARLAIVNGYASPVCRDGYDVAPFGREDVLAMAEYFHGVWGEGQLFAAFSPHLAFDEAFIEVCGRLERFVCGPTTALAWGHYVADLDVRDLAGRIEVPTLVYFTGDLTHVTVEQCRDLADRIPLATLVEAPGDLFYVPDESPQLEDLAAFIGGRIEPDPTAEATVVFVDVVGSTDHANAMGDARWLQVLDDLDAFVEREVALRNGRVVKQTGDGHLAVFGDAVDGVSAAAFIADGVTALGIQIRAGVHLGHVSFRSNGDIGGMTVHFAARVCAAAPASQVFVSEAIATHLGSGPFRFEDCGERDFKGIPGHHTVLAALPY